MGRAHRTPRQQGTGFEGREPTQMTGTGGTRRSGGPAGVSTTDQEHGRATPETPGVRVHTLTAEEKGAWVDDINAGMAALAPIERRAAAGIASISLRHSLPSSTGVLPVRVRPVRILRPA